MVSNAILIGIVVAAFFVGLSSTYLIFHTGSSDVIFSGIYDPNTMKFANQELFDQMISNNPKMTAQWMESMMQDPESNQQMMQQMNDMMNDPKLRQQMITMMNENQDFMQDMMQNNQMMDMMKTMMDSPMMDSMIGDSNIMSSNSFNPEMPITIPMIDGYYNDEKVFFIHTEISDQKMANMMSMMVNFPTIHVSDLENIPEEDLGKFYVFTNGIPGTGPYGGGPFMFQIDIFDTVPGQDEYSEFRVPQLVTWNDNSAPRILTSVDELLQAETNGDLSINSADFVVHLPMIIWDSGTKKQAEHIKKPFITMPKFDAQVINIDEDNYTVTLQFHPIDSMDIMN